MHVTWAVNEKPIYELSLTLCREEVERLWGILLAGAAEWNESPEHQYIVRALTDAICEATQKEN